MSQVTDRTVGANPTGFDMRTELNNIIAALESDNSGSSEPLNTVAYMKWLDTSNATYYYYKERNHDNTAWVTLFRYTVATKIMEAVNNGTNLTTALALKANLASPTFTGTVVLPSTTSIGTITNTELSYIYGVTSNIQTQFTGKQATLVSGTNIKTINSNSILGSGDIVINAGISLATANSYDIGVGQTWQDVTASRAMNTTYTNNSGKPISVSVRGTASGNSGTLFLYINNILMCANSASPWFAVSATGIVPNGNTYKVTADGGVGYSYWLELI